MALARIVMAHREHIIALEPLDKGMLGTTLRYDYEVRDEKYYFKEIPQPRIAKDMVKLPSTSSTARLGTSTRAARCLTANARTTR